MKLIPLRHSKPAFKRLKRRMEAYHSYKAQSAFTDYYEKDQIGVCPYIEDESFLPKRKLKRKRKRKI